MNHLHQLKVKNSLLKLTIDEFDFLNKNYLSVDTQAKLVMIYKSCQYEPSSPIKSQEQPFEVDYLNKKFLSVDTQAKLVMIHKSC